MTLAKVREMLALHVDLGSGYNRNAVRLILAEVNHEHGQAMVDSLIEEFDLSRHFGLRRGTVFKRPSW